MCIAKWFHEMPAMQAKMSSSQDGVLKVTKRWKKLRDIQVLEQHFPTTGCSDVLDYNPYHTQLQFKSSAAHHIEKGYLGEKDNWLEEGDIWKLQGQSGKSRNMGVPVHLDVHPSNFI